MLGVLFTEKNTGGKLLKNVEEIHFANASGEKLWGRLFRPNARTQTCVIVCHGFAGKSNSKNKIGWATAMRRELGAAVLAFDFSGCGKSQGEFRKTSLSKQVGDLECAIEFALKKGFTKIALVGHSFGGIVSIVEAGIGKYRKEVFAIAAIATPYFIHKYPDVLFDKKKAREWPKAGVIEFKDGRFGYTLNYSFKKDQKKYDFERIVKNMCVPTLVIHGTSDKIVPVLEGKMIYACTNCSKELILIRFATHSLKEHRKEVTQALCNFFSRF